MKYRNSDTEEETLDPQDWDHYKALAHEMMEDVFDLIQNVSHQPVWIRPSDDVKEHFRADVPLEEREINLIYQDVKQRILPYRKGNIHPMFFSWVEGSGTISGVLADMLASAMNSNLGIGDHGAIYVEHQVIGWLKQLLGYPSSSSGTILGGGTIANITAMLVARNSYKNGVIRRRGIKSIGEELIVYCSAETHNCIFKGVETLGIGSDNIRKIPVTEAYQIDLELLQRQINSDVQQRHVPFLIIGNAGTVNTGAIDPLLELSILSKEYGAWFHVDGAIAALAKLLPEFSSQFRGIESADSIAFDLHKWLHVNYEAGCLLVKDADLHRSAFIQQSSYLFAHERGLAAGPESFSNFGLDLSRGFKSLKIWMAFQENGIEKYVRLMRQNIKQAAYLATLVSENESLELLTPVTLNIVCYRFYRTGSPDNELNRINKEIVMRMHEQGAAAPSYTILNGKYSIRVCITNHRTRRENILSLVDLTVKIGNQVISEL